MKQARATSYFVAVFTALHALATTGTHLWWLTRAMEISYRGMARTWLDSALEITSNVLLCPLVALIFHLRFDALRGVGAYLVVVTNSLLWAFAAWWIVRRLRRKQAPEPG